VPINGEKNMSYSNNQLEQWHDRKIVNLVRESEHITCKNIAQQCLDELQQIVWLGSDIRVDKFVEVGSDHGGSLWIYANLFCNPGAKVISIDYTGLPVLKGTVRSLEDRGFKTELIIKHSHDASINIQDIGLLHIDAMHSIDAVVGDWNKYYPCVKEGGIILMHDTLLHDGPVEVRIALMKRGFKIFTFGGNVIMSNTTYVPAGISILKKDEHCHGLNYILDPKTVWEQRNAR
jgi:cephalosporin hydroxylase